MNLRIGMWAVCAAALGASTVVRAAPRGELEAGLGAGVADTVAPVAGLRAGVDLASHFTVSARGLLVFGNRAAQGNLAGSPGFQAWAALPELRLHTAHTPQARFEAFLAAGAGVGQLQNMLGTIDETPPYEGKAAFYSQGSVGFRYLGDHLTFGLELTEAFFTQVHGGHFVLDSRNPQPEHQVISASLMLLTFGVR